MFYQYAFVGALHKSKYSSDARPGTI